MESGWARVTVTSMGAVRSTEVTLRKGWAHTLAVSGSMLRRREATTSSAVSSVPSWKRTPGRIW